ncbi:hypothetical protein BGZ98_000671 [Dissophora globulifera]|nr:hypothetical protein BGZ98_000671 [Dissophora globulifera]
MQFKYLTILLVLATFTAAVPQMCGNKLCPVTLDEPDCTKPPPPVQVAVCSANSTLHPYPDLEKVNGESASHNTVRHVIRVNGAYNREKVVKHAERYVAYTRQVTKLQAALKVMGSRYGIGKGPATFRQDILKKYRAIFVLTDANKVALVLELRSAGLLVCNYATEADLHIAQIMAAPLPGGVSSHFAVSRDSDLSVYSAVPSILRPRPSGKDYAMYHK